MLIVCMIERYVLWVSFPICSMIAASGRIDADVENRTAKASRAFGAL